MNRGRSSTSNGPLVQRKEGARVAKVVPFVLGNPRALHTGRAAIGRRTPPTRWPLRLINGFAIAERTLTPHTDHTIVCGDTRREWGNGRGTAVYERR